MTAASMTCFDMSNKQPVLGTKFTGSDALLGEIVVDAGWWIIEKGVQLFPLSQGVVDGFS